MAGKKKILTVASDVVTTNDNDVGEESTIIKIEAPSKHAKLTIPPSIIPIIVPTHEISEDTDGSDSEPETIDVSSKVDLFDTDNLIQKTASGGGVLKDIWQNLSIFDTDSAEQRSPDAVDFGADTFDYTDVNSPGGSATTLKIYPAEVYDCYIELRKREPSKQAGYDYIWDTDLEEQLIRDITSKEEVAQTEKSATITGREYFEIVIKTDIDLSNWYENPAPIFQLPVIYQE